MFRSTVTVDMLLQKDMRHDSSVSLEDFEVDWLQPALKGSWAAVSDNLWCVAHAQADKIVAAIEQRVSQMTGIPEDRAEGLQVLRYETGQVFKAHYDTEDPEDPEYNPSDDPPRMATVIMYLCGLPSILLLVTILHGGC